MNRRGFGLIGGLVLAFMIRVLTPSFASSNLVLPAAAAPVGSDCAALTKLTIPQVQIVSAVDVPAAQPNGIRTGSAETLPTVPAHCRVNVVATPVPDSRIGIEIWIPSAGASWNGKLLGVGNGGFSSGMSAAAMADGVSRGYAVVATDTGHTGDSLDFGDGHPEKIVDWAHRAVHVMTEVAKLVVRNQQGRFPERSYFSGCSTGGQQALSEAQRYPDDYDGIIAGDPGHNRLRLIYGFLWSWLATHDEKGQPILPSSKLPALAAAVVAACDAKDGLKDGLISDPSACRFDPVQLACKGADAETCLTTAQVDAVNKVYDGARNPRTREPIFAGWARGSELGWRGYITDPTEPVRVGFFTGWAFHNPDWNPRSFDWDRDVAYLDTRLSFIDATSTDVGRFKSRGGKLLMYTGLADPVVPPKDTFDYYERVVAASGGIDATRAFFRFFPVPGMGHCGGGAGPNRFDSLAALEAWVERGVAPDRIMATQVDSARQRSNVVTRSRPLCAYPLYAKYTGSGSVDDETRFVCEPRP